MLDIGARVRGWTVTMPLEDSPSGMHDLLAEDAAGGCVVLRVPADLDGVERIRLEADLMRHHSHETLVQSVGIVQHNGWLVQILEHIDGMALDALGLVAGALSPEAVCHVGRQISLALVELHERAPFVFHGALSADRIVVDNGGNVRLTDLGRARPQVSKRLLSPERRVLRAKPSAADDLYALGMILMEAALGHPLDVDDGYLDTRVLDGTISDRLVDALAVLLGPAESRLQSATAAVRVFTELEKHYGDGARSLRNTLMQARMGRAFAGLGDGLGEGNDRDDDDDARGPATIPDAAKITPFRGILLEAGVADDVLAPSTVELAFDPRTMEMGRDAVLTMADLARLASPAASIHEEPTRVKRNPLLAEPDTASSAPSDGEARVDGDREAPVGGHGAVLFAVSAVFAALTVAVVAVVYAG